MNDLIAGGIRPPGAAGFFYPSSPSKLSAVVRDFLNREKSVGGETSDRDSTTSVLKAPRALVVPHAGYDYSGRVAGDAYSTLADHDLDTVIIIAPSHLESFRGVSVFPGVAYRTPLGDCSVASDFADHLLTEAGGTVRASLDGHWLKDQQRQEHSLEVQLPFLQVVMKRAPQILPLVIGDGTWETAETLGRAIASAVKNLRGPGKVVIVASSDLSHFYGDSQAEELDAKTLRLIEAFDAVAFHEELQAGRVEACGGAPIVTAMLAAQALGATVATTLSYTHSGKVMGDSRSVVGYGAVRID